MPIDTRFYEAWFDGSSVPYSQRSGVGGYIITPDQETLTEYSSVIPYTDCPFILEYTAIIHLIRTLQENRIRNVCIYGDSKWVIQKLQKVTTKYLRLVDNDLKLLHHEALELLYGFTYCRIQWISREKNERAHELCRLATRGDLYERTGDNRETTTSNHANTKEFTTG
jgi:ribonuclease HI